MVKTPEWIKDFEITTLIFIAIVSLVVLQVASIVITQVGQSFGQSPEQLKLGPAFLIIITGAAVWMTFETIRTYRKFGAVSKPSLLLIALISAAVIASYIYLPKMVPGIFEQAVMQLQSALSGG